MLEIALLITFMQNLPLAFNYLYVSPCQLQQVLGLEKCKQWVEVGYLGFSTSLNMEAALLTMKYVYMWAHIA